MSEQVPSENRQDAPVGENAPTEDEVSLLDLLIVLAKHRRIVVGFPFVAAVLAVTVSLLLPNVYTASARILPPQQSGSASAAILSQLGGVLGGLAGAAGGGLIKNPVDLYLGMLKSRTVADNLIERFGLDKLYEQKFQSDTRRILEHKTSITVGKDGIILIEVDDQNPRRAADLANAYVDELMNLTKVLAVTEASQRRLFFERQLLQAKDNLTAAEVAARQGLQKGGLAQVDAQGRSMIEVTARLRAQVSVKEVQLDAMRTFAAEGNPEMQRTRQELEALRRELARIEGSSAAIAISKADVSGNTGLNNLGRLRDVKYHEFLYELLAKQYELARIDEAKDSTIIQVLDKAVEPDRKSKPVRSVIVILSTLFAMLVGIGLAFVLEAMANANRDPQQALRLQALKRYLAWRQDP